MTSQCAFFSFIQIITRVAPIRFVQFILKRLPPYLAAKMLVSAIRRHAWTFVGSGRFKTYTVIPIILEIAANPLCSAHPTNEPACFWHVAVFQRLFQVLISPRSTVVETECESAGCDCCRFVVNWPG
ncbi:MAG: bacteriochlorophyll 4-vinyl reductase, partial [Rhodospirillales bacterium 20-64-7]